MRLLIAMLLGLAGCSWHAGLRAASDADLAALAGEVRALKRDAMQLHTDLQRIETELFHPDELHTAVYVAMDLPDFMLEHISIQVDGHELARHRYTPQDNAALRLGGLQRLYLGNLPPGTRRLQARIQGRFEASPPLERSVDVQLSKQAAATAVELRISSNRRHDLVLDYLQQDLRP